ncbi:unnamed protein product [Clavelina lepadiformis]|uniref:Uncharacterized protein n=1 Tax=Clavelina lepadiformis TaxID=159417 RepID=A0ABP0H1M9_CLALP
MKLDFFLVRRRSTDFLCVKTVSVVRICACAQLRGNIALHSTVYTLIAMQNAHQGFLGKEAHVGSMTNIEVLISTLYVSTISKIPKKSLNHQNP